jgi:5'-AMP-activated protein kinase regulatory beta subunit
MKEKSKRIEFRIVAPQAVNVHLCGSFNHWSESSDAMKKDSTGTWAKTKMLTKGVYEYKFLVDGDWTLDPECPDTASNEFGTENNVIWIQI